mmetsp:Transcript_36789/g.66509  ORF Transcript_36789/g.66509 Transcript_36789/m.66509 type:complete len:157 (-) Transcript_36789:36-506(-)
MSIGSWVLADAFIPIPLAANLCAAIITSGQPGTRCRRGTQAAAICEAFATSTWAALATSPIDLPSSLGRQCPSARRTLLLRAYQDACWHQAGSASSGGSSRRALHLASWSAKAVEELLVEVRQLRLYNVEGRKNVGFIFIARLQLFLSSRAIQEHR